MYLLITQSYDIILRLIQSNSLDFLVLYDANVLGYKKVSQEP